MIGYGNSYFISTILDTESGVPPVNTAAPAITGTAQEGQTLTCSTGTWTGTPTIAYSYQWKRNGSNIGSATNSTYLLVSADVGQSIKCTVTATNGAGSANADSNTVTPTAALDPDAQAFLTAAGITDATITSAINNLTLNYKSAGLWTLNKAIYPFVGGTSSTHKWNLKDPRDLNAAYRLLFNGGWTHSSTGALPNGTNGWANTYLVAQGTLGLNSTHVSAYSRTNADKLAPAIGNVTGAVQGEISMWLRFSNTAYLRVNSASVSNTANADSRGMFIGSRVNSTQVTLSIRGTQTTFSQNSDGLYTQPIQLGGVNPNNFDNKELAFVSIGDGYTSQNMTDETTIVNAFQAALSRNV
jgi:hypothetical protein